MMRTAHTAISQDRFSEEPHDEGREIETLLASLASSYKEVDGAPKEKLVDGDRQYPGLATRIRALKESGLLTNLRDTNPFDTIRPEIIHYLHGEISAIANPHFHRTLSPTETSEHAFYLGIRDAVARDMFNNYADESRENLGSPSFDPWLRPMGKKEEGKDLATTPTEDIEHGFKLIALAAAYKLYAFGSDTTFQHYCSALEATRHIKPEVDLERCGYNLLRGHMLNVAALVTIVARSEGKRFLLTSHFSESACERMFDQLEDIRVPKKS